MPSANQRSCDLCIREACYLDFLLVKHPDILIICDRKQDAFRPTFTPASVYELAENVRLRDANFKQDSGDLLGHDSRKG